MAVSAHEALAFDMPFAKIVQTSQGDAVLIGGKVFHISGPDGNAADVFARALRSMNRESGLAGQVSNLNQGVGIVGIAQ